MANLILSAFSDEYADSFAAQLAAMKRLDFGYIELRHADKVNVAALSDEQVAEISARLQEEGIQVSALGSPLGKVAIDSPLQPLLDQTKRLCEIACRLNTERMRIFSFYLPKDGAPADYKNQVLDRLAKMLEIAKDYGIILGHENEAGIYGESPERCLELMEAFGGDLRCVFDMGNFLLEGYAPYPAYEMLLPYIEWFHIKDGLSAGAIVPAGKGEACIREILKDYSAREAGKIFITLEPHLQTFSGLNALTDRAFDNPYKYENQQAAFEDAVKCLGEVLR